MIAKPLLCVMGLLVLGACSSVSTGVRSPCFKPKAEIVTRGANYLTGFDTVPGFPKGGGNACYFQNL